MNNTGFNKNLMPAKVLVAPLEWGLGHATRCIPIIQSLLDNGCVVIIAGDVATRKLLQQEFPTLTFLPLKSYGIKYAKAKWLFSLAMTLQIPKIIFHIYKEHQWLKNVVNEHKIDLVISDNRLGLYHKTAHSIYITHQLQVKTSNKFFDAIARKIHYWFIEKYNQCWVPDYDNENSVAGNLSNPLQKPLHTKYIGCLSRFELQQPSLLKEYDLLILLSGPEPQRTIFENILLNQLNKYKGNVLFVRGLPNNAGSIQSDNHSVKIENYLSANDLNIAIQQSKLVISRSGYTTVMDLIKLQQKAILVPTPGQTEQEYLAAYLKEKGLFYTIEQNKFSLQTALIEQEKFNNQFLDVDMELYKNVVNDCIQSMST